MICKAFGFARNVAAQACDVVGFVVDALVPADDFQVRAAERAVDGIVFEEEVSEPTGLAYTDDAGDYPPMPRNYEPQFRCADCGWTSFNEPALRKHRQVEHPTGKTKALLDEAEAGGETYVPLAYTDAAGEYPPMPRNYTKTSAAKPSPGADSVESGTEPLTVPDSTTTCVYCELPIVWDPETLREPGIWVHSRRFNAACEEGDTVATLKDLSSVAVSTGCSDTGQPAGERPDPSGPTLANWLEPAILEVLCQHVPSQDYIGIHCNSSDLNGPHDFFEDWHEWQYHLADILSAHLAQALEAKGRRDSAVDGERPTSELLRRGAKAISWGVSGLPVPTCIEDKWRDEIRELEDRAATFEAIEQE